MPDGCTDENRAYTELLCYKMCDNDYVPMCTTCTRSSCPYGTKTLPGSETALNCTKQIYYAGNPIPAIPSASDLINGLFDIGSLVGGLQRIVLNAGVIILILFSCFFVLASKTLLVSNKIKFTKKLKLPKFSFLHK